MIHMTPRMHKEDLGFWLRERKGLWADNAPSATLLPTISLSPQNLSDCVHCSKMLGNTNYSRSRLRTLKLHPPATLSGTAARKRLDPLLPSEPRCWKHSSQVLVHVDMTASRSCCRSVGCTSMMQVSRSTASQSCSFGLRSGDCGDRWSSGNSMWC